jgi:hypothetical protein
VNWVFSLYRLLIKQGARVSDKDLEGNTPLHLAAESGNRSFSSLNEIVDEGKKRLRRQKMCPRISWEISWCSIIGGGGVIPLPPSALLAREYWMILKKTRLFGSTPNPLPPLPSVILTGDIQDDWETFCWWEGGEGVGEELNHTILRKSGPLCIIQNLLLSAVGLWYGQKFYGDVTLTLLFGFPFMFSSFKKLFFHNVCDTLYWLQNYYKQFDEYKWIQVFLQKIL